jgi:ligand-binding SRPBCC domain-containing protein
MKHFVRESRISAPPEVVFTFHESPGAFERLIPPWENVKSKLKRMFDYRHEVTKRIVETGEFIAIHAARAELG